MTTELSLIDIIDQAYDPDGFAVPSQAYDEDGRPKDAVGLREVGDTLAVFIALELNDACDDPEEFVGMMRRARDQLDRVINAVEDTIT